MRSDMDKVVTERERTGGGVGPKGEARMYRVRVDDADEWTQLDAMPKHESMRFRHNRDRKSFTDVLGPLHGFLLKNAGRPWNKVKSEMARHLPKDSVQHIHVWSHVKDFVNEQIVCIEGKLYEKRVGWRYHKEPFHVPLDHTNRRIELFVDPRTGLLRKNKWYKSRWYGAGDRRTPKEEVRRDTKDPMVQLHKLNGLWFEVQLGTVGDVPVVADPATRRPLAELAKVYGRAGVIGVKKKALNSKQLRALGLVNDPPAIAA